MEWLTRPDTEYELPNIDWVIAVFDRNKRDYENPDPIITSWEHPVVALRDLLKKRLN